jgi:molybdate transport system substrate-binding protein
MRHGFAAAIIGALVMAGTCSEAAELKVISAGSVMEAFKELVPAFTRESGHKVETSFGPVGALQTRLKNGETADVIILSGAAMEELDKTGSLVPGSRSELGRAANGVAVRVGAPVPDISTPEALKSALVAARSIAFPDPASGGTAAVHVVSLVEWFGIADAVKKKALLKQRGFEIANAVADGTAELGITFISELLPNKGVKVVGPIPPPIELVVPYVAGVASGSQQAEAARAFIAFLTRPAARERFTTAGL